MPDFYTSVKHHSNKEPKQVFLNDRHEYLEKKVARKEELQRCYCGNHRDEKLELARYRRAIASDEMDGLSFEQKLEIFLGRLSATDRKLFLDDLVNGA